MAVPTIHTIGHSTRTTDELIALLQAHGIAQLTDVRTYPMSRRLPHFNREPFAAALRQQGIDYRHLPALGGRRRPRPDSINGAWQHESFRGYADHMATPEFARGLEELLQYAANAPTAMMCAEAVWWRCHRRLIADALVAGGVPVLHIMSSVRASPHELTPFAVVRDDASVVYPGLLDLSEQSNN
jgi:uncharacterized protein (DUF488 family)